MRDVRIVASGDAAMTIEFESRIAPEINARVLAVADAIRRRCATALRDVVVGYCTVTVFYEPLRIDPAWMEAELRDAVAEARDRAPSQRAIVDVPVVYGGDFGPDLGEVAAFGSCSPDEVVALHSAPTYTVYLLGFVPGFAYMAEVDPRIAAPRRSAPRSVVPAGSVGIAGAQTGIYPVTTPGGWNIIGRTPLKPYDPSRRVPFLLEPGDRVRFRPVPRHEVERYA